MKSVRRLLSLSALFALFAASACGTVSDWREVRSAPMAFGDCYDGLIYAANHTGFAPDVSVCDRGMGLWQSRWRLRALDLNRPCRYRLRAEVMIDEGSNAAGWPIRYVIEQQKVKDLRHSTDPTEADWSDDYQDREKEAIFGEQLARRLSPKV